MLLAIVELGGLLEGVRRSHKSPDSMQSAVAIVAGLVARLREQDKREVLAVPYSKLPAPTDSNILLASTVEKTSSSLLKSAPDNAHDRQQKRAKSSKVPGC